MSSILKNNCEKWGKKRIPQISTSQIYGPNWLKGAFGANLRPICWIGVHLSAQNELLVPSSPTQHTGNGRFFFFYNYLNNWDLFIINLGSYDPRGQSVEGLSLAHAGEALTLLLVWVLSNLYLYMLRSQSPNFSSISGERRAKTEICSHGSQTLRRSRPSLAGSPLLLSFSFRIPHSFLSLQFTSIASQLRRPCRN